MPKSISRRTFIGSTAGAGLAAAVGGSVPATRIETVSAAAAAQGTPPTGAAQDVMLVNGQIHTMDARNTIANTVTVRNGRIAAVGTAAPRTAPAGMQATIFADAR